MEIFLLNVHDGPLWPLRGSPSSRIPPLAGRDFPIAVALPLPIGILNQFLLGLDESWKGAHPIWIRRAA